ncbi:MAG: TRAP transporter small permease [Candidatus Aerophobetes bacterium]|nr:TRAP transporter small permease [Candidatus Aerophobetes bacterium]
MFYRYLRRIVEIVVIFASAAMTFILIIQVFLRYVLKTSIPFSAELARYLMVWVVFLAAGLALKEDTHISIRVLVDKLPGRARSSFNLAAQILLLVFLVLLMIESIAVLPYQRMQIILSMGVSVVWFYLAIPVGCSIMILFLFPKMYEKIKKIFGKINYVKTEHTSSD